jgi:hypothetical protein
MGGVVPSSRTCMGKINSDTNLRFDARLCTALRYAGDYYSKTIEKKGEPPERKPDRLEAAHFEHDSFGGYTTVCEAKGFHLRGWGAGGGTGLVGVVGINGGTVMTVEKS